MGCQRHLARAVEMSVGEPSHVLTIVTTEPMEFAVVVSREKYKTPCHPPDQIHGIAKVSRSYGCALLGEPPSPLPMLVRAAHGHTLPHVLTEWIGFTCTPEIF